MSGFRYPVDLNITILYFLKLVCIKKLICLCEIEFLRQIVRKEICYQFIKKRIFYLTEFFLS